LRNFGFLLRKQPGKRFGQSDLALLAGHDVKRAAQRLKEILSKPDDLAHGA